MVIFPPPYRALCILPEKQAFSTRTKRCHTTGRHCCTFLLWKQGTLEGDTRNSK